jgi:pyruvate-formate lyase-activating enzyme
MELTVILEILKEYDAVALIGSAVVYYLLDKKIKGIDKAVNCRAKGEMTISQEVTEINHKLDLFSNDLKHVKKEVDAHRAVDEVAFQRVEKDIRIIANKV